MRDRDTERAPLSEEELDGILRLPKVELHLHIEGAAPPAFIRGLAKEKSVSSLFSSIPRTISRAPNRFSMVVVIDNTLP